MLKSLMNFMAIFLRFVGKVYLFFVLLTYLQIFQRSLIITVRFIVSHGLRNLSLFDKGANVMVDGKPFNLGKSCKPHLHFYTYISSRLMGYRWSWGLWSPSSTRKKLIFYLYRDLSPDLTFFVELSSNGRIPCMLFMHKPHFFPKHSSQVAAWT